MRETFGALMATVQSSRATDPEIRVAMTRIAHDETEHAALAWDVAAWVETRLDVEARDAVRRERDRATRELAATLERSSFTSAVLGLPSSREASLLFATMTTPLAA